MAEEEPIQEPEPVPDSETLTESGYAFSWPMLQFDHPPQRTYHFYHQFRTASNPNNFLKGVKWSPDGSYFVTSSEDNTLRVFDLYSVFCYNAYGILILHPTPMDFVPNLIEVSVRFLEYLICSSSSFSKIIIYPSSFCNFNRPDYAIGIHADACSCTVDGDSYVSNLIVSEAESVYDYCWYPYMSASDPTSCVFASTTRDHPIHLWDSISGQLRCTYRAYDSMDEITAAFSIAFNLAGTKLFAGYNKSLRVFDVHRPGRDFEQYSTLQGNKDVQSGIISAIAFSPTHSGMLATGSYSQTTAIYAEDNMELLYVLHGQMGGVTHVTFSKDGNYLYTGGRKDPYILCWDIRNTTDVVYKLYRSSECTNQRIFFDIEPCGRHLGTGGQDGQVHIYDLQSGQWLSSFQAASDTVNGFCFHPSLPMAASSSGHRRFSVLDDCAENMSLSGEENCVSVWSFNFTSIELDATDVAYEDTNS